jgi:hypothetical protein
VTCKNQRLLIPGTPCVLKRRRELKTRGRNRAERTSRKDERVCEIRKCSGKLRLRRKPGRLGHNDHSPHDGMNPALIGITTGREIRNGIAACGVNGSGVKTAPVSFFKASVMSDRMVCRSRIVPSDRSSACHRHRCGHVIGRSTVHQDATLWWCGA